MIQHRMIYNVYTDWSFDVERAEGDFVWTKDGKKLIDLTSGWNTTNLGWNNPEVAEAIVSQLKKNSYTPMWTADEAQKSYAELLTDALPAELSAVGRGTGGTEANEMAIKTARAFTGRKKIVGFQETYHGQSAGTLIVGMPPEYIESSIPLNPNYLQIEYPQTYRTEKSPEQLLRDFSTKLEQVLAQRDVAAIITEAGMITGWGSCYVAPEGYLAVVRKLTKEYGTLMILDEVGTGFSRCGKLFGLELAGVTPDIVTFAKAITNGAVPLGAMVTRIDIAEATFAKSALISTFGWVPVACAAAQRTLEIHRREKIWEKAKRDGDYIVKKLKEELGNHPRVGDIRGIGMELGIDIVKNKTSKEADTEGVEKVVRECFQRGLHIVCDHHSNIQLMPPLTIARTNLDDGLGRLIEGINAAV